MSEKSPYRIPKIKPHDEDEDFDFRQIHQEEENLSHQGYAIYEDENIDEERKKIITSYGFHFEEDHWIRNTEEMSEEDLEDLEFEGIVVEKI